MILVQTVVLGMLLWASMQDLKTHLVSDKVWIVGGAMALIVSLFSPGLFALSGMIVQGLILFGVGLLLNIFSSFGMADVIALFFIGISFPGTRVLSLASVILVSAVGYQRFYSELMDKRAVPLIPGLLIGFIFALTVF